VAQILLSELESHSYIVLLWWGSTCFIIFLKREGVDLYLQNGTTGDIKQHARTAGE